MALNKNSMKFEYPYGVYALDASKGFLPLQQITIFIKIIIMMIINITIIEMNIERALFSSYFGVPR